MAPQEPPPFLHKLSEGGSIAGETQREKVVLPMGRLEGDTASNKKMRKMKERRDYLSLGMSL